MDLQSWAAVAAIVGTLLAMLGTQLASFAAMNRKIDGLDQKFESKIDGLESRLESKIDGLDQKFESKIDGLESRLESKIDGLRVEMHHGFTRVDDRLNIIEQRTYDLSTRLPPAPAAKHG